ncbi:MAG: endonuclease, partial [Bacteroidetes bacterium]|nr:endonuclease [Bacteroidota bacterium]
MKKQIITSMLLLFAGVFSSFAQLAPVPTPNYSFDTPLPPGWFSQLLLGTSVNTTYTGTAACTTPSCRLDNTGEFVLIHFASQPGPVSYKIKASVGGTVTSFVGTFSIQESADSITWLNMRQFNDGQMATSCTPYTDIPATTSRYIRFFFNNKVSGANVALDDISVAVPSVPGPAVNVLQGGNPVINNGFVQVQSPVGVNTPFSLGIQNFGNTNALSISSITVTGPAAADYAITGNLTTVAPSTTSNLTIDFTPGAAGSRNAILTIVSNDANQPNYVININGVGGMYASEPPAQPSALSFSDVKTYRFKGSYNTTAAPVDFYGGYLVVRGRNGVPLTPPSDGKVYMRGDTVGNDGIVTRVSKDSIFYPIYIHANTTYHFRVYAFNGAGPATNYKQDNPLSGSVTTPTTMMPAGEYSGINTGSSTFINDLHNLINPHTSIYYSNYASTIGNKFEVRDTTRGRTAVTCRYTTYTAVFTNGMVFGTADSSFSREHTYAHSWMPTYDASNPERPEYDDQHHLFPVKFVNANNIRSNYPFGEVVTVTNSFMGGTLGLDANSQSIYEPK